MTNSRFEKFQHAADDALLEQAQMPAARKRKPSHAPLALAACVCLAVAASAVILRPWESLTKQPSNSEPSASVAQLANPVHEETAESLKAIGYTLPVPAEAQDVVYSSISISNGSEADEPAPIAQADYTVSGLAYTLRAQKDVQDENLSGLYLDWTEDLSWNANGLDLTLRTDGDYAAASWYVPEEDTQYSLSAEASTQALLMQVQKIALDLGHSIADAPAGAQDVTLNAFSYNGMTIAETAFTLDGAQWVYRTAATGEVSIIDISGMEQEFADHAETQVSYCTAELSYDESGAGKILWLDVAPGLAYSLTVDRGANEQILSDMANQLFTPMQGEVG